LKPDDYIFPALSFFGGVGCSLNKPVMNDKQREYVTAIIKIVIIVLLAGLVGGKFFNLDLQLWHYIAGLFFVAFIFTVGFLLQKD